MACNKNRYAPVDRRKREPIYIEIKKYDNRGSLSKIIK